MRRRVDEGPDGAAGSGQSSQPRELYVGTLTQPQETVVLGEKQLRRIGEYAAGGPHTLVVGGTGTGKGRRILAPNIIRWGCGPVVAMSAKGDLVELTIRKRAARGPVYLLDLSCEVHESELQGVPVQCVVSDPCALVATDDEAYLLAETLLSTESGSGEGSGDDVWTALATAPLAAMLRAGGVLPGVEDGDAPWHGGGIRWVVSALDTVETPPDEISIRDAGNDPVRRRKALEVPCWDVIYSRASMLHSRHAAAFLALMRMDERQRDSAIISMVKALKAWRLSTVTGGGSAVAFHPLLLEEEGATLYIVSPPDGSLAGAATAVIEQIIQHWRRNIAKNLRPLGLFLDEIAQSAPLPKLPEHIAVLRGYGVHLMAAVQTVIQLKRRWGEVGMEEMLRTFPSVLMLPDTPDKEGYELASWFAGEDERVTSNTDARGRSSSSSTRTERIRASELVPRETGTARLLLRGTPGFLVNVPDISETGLLD